MDQGWFLHAWFSIIPLYYPVNTSRINFCFNIFDTNFQKMAIKLRTYCNGMWSEIPMLILTNFNGGLNGGQSIDSEE